MQPSVSTDCAPRTWVDCWSNDDFWKYAPILKVNAELFLRRASRLGMFHRNDTVLNVGCGPGHLEVPLSPCVKDILSVDVPAEIVELCRRNCRECTNVAVATLGRDYTDLRVFGRRFSLILCVSVVQYYQSITEVESLIASAKAVAIPGARLLIADLPRKRGLPGFLWDGFCSVALAAREGYLALLLRTAFTLVARHLGNKGFQPKNPELSFSRRDLESLIRRTGSNGVVLDRNLSIYANRPSLLIEF